MPPHSSRAPTPVRARFGRFELDEANASLLRDGKAVALAPTPFAVLCALVRQPGTLLSKNALLDQVWGHQFVSDSVLKTVISELRTVLDDDARKPRFIETVSRRGYRFMAEAMSPAAAAGSAGTSRRASSFIGRGDALERLRRGWDLACGGKRAMVWVAGEPGIGKTTLIEEFVGHVGEASVARGQCVEHYGSGEAYLPVLEALAQLCRRDSAVAVLLRTVAPTWLLQLPWLCSAEEREALRHELSGIGPHRMLREMGEVLDRYTQERPLLLVTEDLHWSDRGTVQLIDYTARRRGSARLMWLASFRPAEVIALDHPLNRVRHELRLHGLCEEIALDPFSETEVAEYVAQRSPLLAGDDAFVRTLHERTDGVPLFVASVVGEVAARCAQVSDGEAAAARLVGTAVPDNLAAIIDHYVARLDEEQRALLSVAAVCGMEFRVATVADALQREGEAVGIICEALAREQLWLNAPRAGDGHEALERPYAFRHALFRQVLYERIAPTVRAQIHRKIGAVLERARAAGAPMSVVELATHFERGREPMTALRYYAEAAEAALSHMSTAQGMSLTERGLTLLEQAPQGREREALEITLATLRGVAAFQLLGVGLETRNAFARAHAQLDQVPLHPLRPLVEHGFGFVLCLRGEYAEALAVAERAEKSEKSWSASDRSVFLLSACTVQGQVHMLQGRPHAARGWLERGLAALEALDTAPDEAFVVDPRVMLLGLLGIQLLHLGLVQQARARIEQAYARARLRKQPVAQMTAIWCDALLEVRLGNPERVATLADEMQALVDRFAVAQGRPACRWFGGWARARLGLPREGYRRIRKAYEQNVELGMLAGGSENLGYAAEALLLAGDPDAAETQLREALQFASLHGERVYLPQLLLIESAIARARGEADVADASVRRAIAEAREQGAPWLELLARTELCEQEGATPEDRGTLAGLVDRLPEATGTAAVGKARALLEGVKSPPVAA
jgi:DNA-binding winged helix-turn-helix (wHTH) protein/tetratricopeptide (TPR) repeat protein